MMNHGVSPDPQSSYISISSVYENITCLQISFLFPYVTLWSCCSANEIIRFTDKEVGFESPGALRKQLFLDFFNSFSCFSNVFVGDSDTNNEKENEKDRVTAQAHQYKWFPGNA